MCTLLIVSSWVEGVLAGLEVTSSSKVDTFCLWLYCYLGPSLPFYFKCAIFVSFFNPFVRNRTNSYDFYRYPFETSGYPW